MNGRTAIPMKAWKVEAATLTVEKDNLYWDYFRLKDEVKGVEVIRRNVEQIVKIDEPDGRKTHTQELDL